MKSKEKISKYKKIYRIFLISVSVIILVFWITFWFVLKEYESCVSIHCIKEILNNYSTLNAGAVLESTKQELNEFETEETFSQYLKEMIGVDELDYALLTSTSSSLNPVYVITRNNEMFSKVTLINNGCNILGFNKWAVGSEQVWFGAEKSVTINASKGTKVYINGKEISEKYATEKDILLGLYSNTPEGEYIPLFDTYYIDGFYKTPKITAIGANGEECIISADENYEVINITTPATDEQYQSITKVVESLAETYTSYISGVADFETLEKFLYKNSAFYEDVKEQQSSAFAVQGTHSLDSTRISNCQSYDETQVNCDISFNFVYINENNEECIYPSAYEINFIKTDNGWKTVNMVAK